MPVPDELLEILACIECGASDFEVSADWLRCRRCGVAYPVQGDIPMMMPEAVIRPEDGDGDGTVKGP